MTAIDQHISQLLYSHECVIIPNFGAFVATPSSAKIDGEKNIFLPPSKQIGFNRSLSHNDGLLISTYAQASNTTYVLAKISIENYTTELKEQITSGKEVDIDTIGSLKKDTHGNILFSASQTENFCTDSFGLGSFHFAPEIQLTPSKESLQIKRLLKPLTQKHIAATVALLVGLFVISPDVNNEYDTSNTNTASAFDFLSTSESTNQTAYIASTNKISQANNTADIELDTQMSEDQFYLIAGSFKNEKQANRFLQQIHNMGQEQAFVLHSPNNRFRIALNGFNDKAEAVNSMRSYRKKKDFKTVWVMKQ